MPKTTQKSNELFVGMVSKNNLWKVVAIDGSYIEIASTNQNLSDDKTVTFIAHAARELMEN
jgi:hypothetical protein